MEIMKDKAGEYKAQGTRHGAQGTGHEEQPNKSDKARGIQSKLVIFLWLFLVPCASCLVPCIPCTLSYFLTSYTSSHLVVKRLLRIS